MDSTLVTGIFTLGGTVVGTSLGTVLKPFDNWIGRGARRRDERRKRCESLIHASVELRSAIYEYNRLHQSRLLHPDSVDSARVDVAGARYDAARIGTREAITLPYLTGPQELINAAEAVRIEERKFRKLLRAEGPLGSDGAESAPTPLQVASDAYEARIRVRDRGAGKHPVGHRSRDTERDGSNAAADVRLALRVRRGESARIVRAVGFREEGRWLK